MVDLPPPAYKQVATSRANQHYQTCTRPGNEEALKKDIADRVGTFAVRGWIASNGGTTVAVGPWWMDGGNDTTWEVSEPTQDRTTKQTQGQSTDERLLGILRRALRLRARRQEEDILAVNGTPLHPGEIEYTILPPIGTNKSGSHDWTENWGWKVKLTACTYVQHVECSRWTMTCSLYCNNLPSLLQAGRISWKDAIVHHRKGHFDKDSHRWKWERSSRCWPVASSGQKWKVKVRTRHREKSSLERDFRCDLSVETVNRAKIYQRTSGERYKIVMVYDLNTVYGNDISGQRVDVWHDGLVGKFAQFIRPLMPFDPHPAAGYDA
ncbi:hypothetical protein MRS44_010555 [Fusarium solani]|uniref:Uncharacterized protein n=1 Tax=Fusarium solani TaxID=169388 RepID=A0A9P9K8D5_FUSSL|nr:uncharacterized protein B0J15DRAFT_563417 [Fusarium solani]KAH7247976.1 hypothetical protein B0J15DRAFT_563417 [Fusarium solani]KAJ3462002.1 hypothetical protein MRS44_010555 [Fusarium solani]